MPNLDDSNAITSIDPENVLGSVLELGKQIEHAWQEASKVSLSDSYRGISNIVFSGMGGSGLGARVVESVFGLDLPVPLYRVNDYHLPAYVNENSLVFCSSFSGTTEETVSTLNEALAKKAKIIVIAAGGTLSDVAKQHNLPFYQIDPVYNPSKQPRLAIGYTVISTLVLLAKTDLFALTETDIQQAVSATKNVLSHNNPEIPTQQNPAKQAAWSLVDKVTIFVAARHLIGSVHTVKNQMNENSKHFSALFDIPELNHHSMEGLAHPKSNPTNLHFMVYNSTLYEPRIRQRFEITLDVLHQNDLQATVFEATAKTPFAQAFESIQFGSLVNVYLNALYGINPAPIPWVDYFKTKLGQPLGQFK